MKVTEKLMRFGMMYKINKEPFMKNICGDIDGVFLPNIVGLEEGYDTEASLLNSLFEVGFGFVEVGSVSEK